MNERKANGTSLNKYEEALDWLLMVFSSYLRKAYPPHLSNKLEITKNSISVIRELVERATPKKPFKYPMVSLGKIVCPNCNKDLQYTRQNNCDDCGQALDWSE